jgi:hypothetical protein
MKMKMKMKTKKAGKSLMWCVHDFLLMQSKHIRACSMAVIHAANNGDEFTDSPHRFGNHAHGQGAAADLSFPSLQQEGLIDEAEESQDAAQQIALHARYQECNIAKVQPAQHTGKHVHMDFTQSCCLLCCRWQMEEDDMGIQVV